MAVGNLYYKIAAYTRMPTDDGLGNTVSEWDEQFQCRAAYHHLRGGESVMAARLQGKHTQIISVRSSSQTRQITTDWQVRDVRTDDVFNIRDVTHETDRAWISLLVEKGVA
ncbi:phage head closure protein [Rhizobium sp. KVB221]|uniref:Phage head closure protein n=1 Tax=Rhizobium setariae TaxID=2801340 RepID=A0A937CNQ7_9HYPH|nr:phage head closure protein [Rhizobium setariae]MBL0374031.1 phage head closure protein [Rhizobium setariae]